MNGSKLLERGEFLGELSAHAGAAASGAGRLVFVAGEAGVGKTSLIEAFLRRLPGGAVVLTGACDSMSVPMPLGPVLDFAAKVGTDFEALLASGVERHLIFSALLGELERASGLVVVVFEDLHWADEATLDLLRYLGRRVGSTKALLVCSYRDDEVGAKHPLRQLLGDVAAASAVHRVRVPPLTQAAVGELARASAIDPVELHARTGGNPFFVTEVLAAGGSGVPERAGDAVLARAARLSRQARDALELVSLLGNDAAPDMLSALASSAEAVDECVAAGLLVSRGGLCFRHDIAREAIAGSVTPAKRLSAHAAVLAALEASSPAETLPGRGAKAGPDLDVTPARAGRLATLSHHAAAANDGQAVLRYAPTAGRLAHKLGAFREACVQFARAIPYAESLPLTERARLFEDHAGVSYIIDDMETAASSHRRAAELWQQAGQLEPQVRNLRHLAARLTGLGAVREARQVVAEALALAERLPEDAPERADIANFHAGRLMGQRDWRLMLAWAEQAAVVGRATDNHRAVAISHSYAGTAYTIGEKVARSRKELTAAVECAAEHGLNDLLADLQLEAGAMHGLSYRFLIAERRLAAAVQLSRDRDLESSHLHSVAYRAGVNLYLGRWLEAGEDAHWVLGRPSRSKGARLKASLTLGLLRARRGDPEAQEPLDEALSIAYNLLTSANVAIARTEAAVLRGDEKAAVAEASPVYPALKESGFRWQTAALGYLLWKCGVDPELPDDLGGPFAWQIRGRPEAAARRWRRLGCPYEQAVALSECGTTERLLEALAIFERLGAQPMTVTVREALRRLGVSGVPSEPRPAHVTHPAGLTPREQQVLRLMEQGLRNSEIAERNRVSPRTVDNQVSSVLGKLGVRTRTEAVAEAHRRGWVEAEQSRPRDNV